MKNKIFIKTFIYTLILFMSFSIAAYAAEKDANALIQEGMELAKSGDLQKAKEAYEKAVKLNPEFKSIMHQNMGTAYINKAKYVEAIAEFEAACKEKPTNIMYRFNLAQAHQVSGDLDNAIVNYKKITEIDPKLDWPFYNMGVLLIEKKKYDEALDAFKKVEKINPSLAATYMGMATVYTKMNVPEAAKQSYEKALKIEPTNHEAQYNIGVQDLKMGKTDLAYEAFKKATILNPKFAEAYSNMGMIHQQKQEFDKAIPLLLKSLEYKPALEDALVNLATAYRDTKQYEKAIEYANKAIKGGSKRAEILLASIKEEQKEKK